MLEIGLNNILYPFLLITFILYYLGENNWLLGRDHLVGVLLFGAIIGLVLIITLLRIFKINFEAGAIFGIAIYFLVFGTIVDASIDGYFPFDLGLSHAGLIEEVFELFASMFFLHSLLLLCFNSRSNDNPIVIDRRIFVKIFTGALFLSYGNSLLLQNKGEPVPLSRNLVGILIIGLTLSMFYISFVKKSSSKSSEEDLDKNHVKI
jgi:hypothetical protein